MPELPEVETTKRGIEPYISNQSIKKILVRNNKLRIPFNKKLAKEITNIEIKSLKEVVALFKKKKIISGVVGFVFLNYLLNNNKKKL